MLGALTRSVLETDLEAEMAEHAGHGMQDPVGRDGGTPVTAPGATTVLTEIGRWILKSGAVGKARSTR